MLTEKQEHKILHASGLTNSKKMYRSHYVTETNNADLVELVKQGYFFVYRTGEAAMLPASETCFVLTDKGKQKALELSKKGTP